MEWFNTNLPYLLAGISVGGQYALIAIGYTMVYGILRLINFAHGDIFMVAGLIMVYASASMPMYVSIPLVLVATVLLGFVVERVAYKPLRSAPRMSVMISAIGVSYLLQNLALYVTGGLAQQYPSIPWISDTITVLGASTKRVTVITPFLTIILVVLVALIKYTKIGMAMRAGKSSTLRSIVGLVKPSSGSILLNGEEISGKTPEQIVSKGITLVPEGRRVFADLTVLENLKIGAYMRKDNLEDDLNWCYDLFPRLKERHWQLAGTLSGGEQQMLAIARALMSKPDIIMMDELSLGLAPIIVKGVFDIIREINKQGKTILLVEQNANMALHAADHGYVMETGRITLSDTGENLAADESVKAAYLGKAKTKGVR